MSNVVRANSTDTSNVIRKISKLVVGIIGDINNAWRADTTLYTADNTVITADGSH